MRLPPALQPWSDWLAWFAPDIAAAVGEMLVKLDPMLGLPSPARTHDFAEPDGVDGLQRRGSYERLLLSEWAVADAVPDEFLRRAAGGEHLFLAPRRRATKIDRTLVALFDAGPAQLGAPRLAQVTLWILLARRAAASGARYAWGVLQAPDALHDGGSPAMLAQLLAARTFAPVTAAHRRRWAEASGAHGAGECWTIGAGPQADLGATHTASIVHGFDGRLHVTLATPRGRRDLAVAVPDGYVAKRLLEGAFLGKPPAAATGAGHDGRRLALQQPPLFSWQGRHVAVPVLDESLTLIYSVPVAPGQPPRHRPTRWAEKTSLAFAALDERHLCGATPTEKHLRLWQMDILRQAPLPPEFQITPGRATWRWCARFHTPAVGSTAFVAYDDAGTLAQWTRARDAPQFALIRRDVIGALRADNDHVLYAHRVADTLELFRHRPADGGVAKIADVAFHSTPVRCLFVTSLQKLAAIAVETVSPAGPRWFVDAMPDGEQQARAPRELALGENWKVVGLVYQDVASDRYGLLALDATRRQLLVVGREGPALHVARHAIATASTSPDGTHIALIDHARTLTLLDWRGRVLLQTQGDGRG